MFNLANIITESAKDAPDKLAIVYDPLRLTYKQLDQMSNQVANGLKGIGVRPGDKVALCCPNLPYFPIVYYGVLKVGAVFVPLNVLLKKREIAYHLEDSESTTFICFEGTPELPLLREGYEGFKQVDSCRNFYVIPTQPGADSPVEGEKTLNDLMGQQSPEFDMVQRRPDDTCLIIYTSGTTGRPKGAELTHSNILMNRFISTELFDTQPDDVSLGVLPLFHSFGISVMDACLLRGGTFVLMTRFEPGKVLENFQKEGISVFAGVPTMYWDLLSFEGADKFDIDGIAKRLRVCISGGAALPLEVLKGFEQKFKVKILEGYGLSETSPTATFNRMDRERKVGSIGLAIWGCEVKIVDDDMNEKPVGEAGEVVIRGHNVMKGYYKRDEANEEVFRGGWFHTGDVGTMDEDGYFYIVDRVKDMIIRGGFNVYPRELEEVLVTHPDISLAAVIGVPHEEYGEEIKAYVIPRPGADLKGEDVVAWAKQEMAAYKYPRMVEVVENLPLGPTGKILKKELRAMDAEKREAAPAK